MASEIETSSHVVSSSVREAKHIGDCASNKRWDKTVAKLARHSRSSSLKPELRQHIDRICDTLSGATQPPVGDPVSASWLRSARTYGIDPTSTDIPLILTNPEIASAQQKIDSLTAEASFELDRLYNVVRSARYTVLLCNDDGVVVESRADLAEAEQLKRWGLWRGGVWSEAAEGTNGIGTCIAERQPVTVHCAEHFRTQHISLSCSSAPIFDPDGELIAALDVSCGYPGLSEQSLALTGALTIAAARSIEERLFRTRFNRKWIVALVLPDADGSTLLLALDSNHDIVGSDHAARQAISKAGCVIGKSLWDFFEKDPVLFRNKHSEDLHGQLQRVDSGERWQVFVTPPQRSSMRRSEGDHARLRMTTLAGNSNPSPRIQARGGLPPGVLRRVKEHVESHLDDCITLEALAATAGLSMHHFARAFKHSTGLAPHQYLLQQRIERARDMLVRTEIPLSEIALATGFSDQSHFARQFRQFIGMPPKEFRWQHR
jgi:transcriptional regulator of acetoin/glycerol metabolism